jgi:endonuclease YncB( thermonuclease family)
MKKQGKGPRSFIDQTLWPEFQDLSAALSAYLSEITEKLIREEVHGETSDAEERDGRIIAICFKGSEDLNRWMVASGWAVAYRKYSLDYVAVEERAHLAKAGIWSGTFKMPWDWRTMKK